MRRSSAACRCTDRRTCTAPRAPAHNIFGVAIACAALLGVLLRPFRINEAWWAAGGAVTLVAAGIVLPRDAAAALVRGIDVYLFLIGMMALAEFARVEGVFDWIAARTVRAAHGSPARLLVLVYGAGVVTTALLSNDATIVVLTPAVLGAVQRCQTSPLPYAFACALVANAASFTLPIANPSNLLFFADGMPPLGAWLAAFTLPSLASIALTYAALRFLYRRDLRASLAAKDDAANAPVPRRVAVLVLAADALALVATSSRGGPLGTVAVALGVVAALAAATRDRSAPRRIASGIAWPIVVLTASLFVIVEALDAAGAAELPRGLYAYAAHLPAPLARVVVGAASALASNVVNNLPVGLDLGRYVGAAHPPAVLNAAALIGVNVGPNCTVNGSLATLLWLAIVRRNGLPMTAAGFARIGLLATPPALIAATLLTR